MSLGVGQGQKTWAAPSLLERFYFSVFTDFIKKNKQQIPPLPFPSPPHGTVHPQPCPVGAGELLAMGCRTGTPLENGSAWRGSRQGGPLLPQSHYSHTDTLAVPPSPPLIPAAARTAPSAVGLTIPYPPPAPTRQEGTAPGAELPPPCLGPQDSSCASLRTPCPPVQAEVYGFQDLTLP